MRTQIVSLSTFRYLCPLMIPDSVWYFDSSLKFQFPYSTGIYLKIINFVKTKQKLTVNVIEILNIQTNEIFICFFFNNQIKTKMILLVQKTHLHII